jgi:NAD(P)-dependent dehydrogenase (short-subunit alcohol dehydrogenase family)
VNKKVAIITGATSWMALATHYKLTEQGWITVLCSHEEMDVDNPDAVNEYFDRMIKHYGQIHAVVNIAGKSLNKLFHETTPEEFDKILGVNFRGVVNTTRAVLPHFMESYEGNIVSIVSKGAYTGFPQKSAYCSAKAATNVFMKVIAQEYGRWNIRANTILPGYTKNKRNSKSNPSHTNPSPLGRITYPEDVGKAVGFLLSDEASHVTGSCLDISGGCALH